ncbi:GAF and ANTAR domain-containing protein [Frigoribacterium sp. UYMn621]|uniref:GAF and ANTAR domain-containing protein n=1 Tax=Frigoribacterium sp. UYMn621 TaxID=3156343 RepID=UPI003397C62E
MMAEKSGDPTGPHNPAKLDLCQPFLNDLPISGASVTVISSSGTQVALCASDAVAARLDELHFELGEGPQWVATKTGTVVLLPDLASVSHDQWPIFAASIGQLKVGAIFSIPIRMGAATVGAATLYRESTGGLDEDHQSSALAIASAIASTAVQRAMTFATDDAVSESEVAPALRREVHQATGMIMVHLDSTATIAYSRLQGYALAQGRTVLSVARDVVARALTFDNLPL